MEARLSCLEKKRGKKSHFVWEIMNGGGVPISTAHCNGPHKSLLGADDTYDSCIVHLTNVLESTPFGVVEGWSHWCVKYLILEQ